MTNEIGLAAIFIMGLTGSPHCAGMCGGYVTFYSGQSNGSAMAHGAYSLGRLLTYTALGAFAGYLGSKVDSLGQLAGYQDLAAALLALLMIFWGLNVFLKLAFLEKLRSKVAAAFHALIQPTRKLLAKSGTLDPTLLAFALGLLSTFLPCGFLYMFVALAAGSAAPLKGAAILAVFWLSTLPVMLTLGSVIGLLSDRARRFVPRVTAMLLIAAGIYSLGHQIQMLDRPLAAAGQPACHHTQAK